MFLNKNIKHHYQVRLYSTKNEIRINEIIKSIKNTNNFNIALTHKSCIKDNKILISYERLEFLGDSILEQHVSIFLYYSFPEYSEGVLTTLRMNLVLGKYLNSISLKIGLNKYLILGESLQNIDFNKKSLSKKHSKIPGDILESFIAALYIEKGSKILFEFLFLTVLDKPEFRNKFEGFINDIFPLLYTTSSHNFLVDSEIKVKNNIKPTSGETLLEFSKDQITKTNSVINLPNSINSASYPTGWKEVISDNEIKNKLNLFLNKSLKNQDDIIELLIKNYILMENKFLKEK